MAHLTRDDGYRNLAAHYPPDAHYPKASRDKVKKYPTFKPDLGKQSSPAKTARY